MTVSGLLSKLPLKAVALPEEDREVTGGYIGDLLSWVMGKAKSGDAWITIMSNLNIVAVASLTDVACIILAENVQLDEDIISLASNKGVNILSYEGDAFSLAGSLNELLNE